MGEKIVIASGRGGVGKTSVAANLGRALARAGKIVLLIDADTGMRSLDIALGLENNVVYDAVDVAEGTCRIKQALLSDLQLPGLKLLAAAQTRERADLSCEGMRDILRRVGDKFDYVLIDAPAGTEHGFDSACAGANAAIIVTALEPTALRSAQRMVGLMEWHSLPRPRVIFNRVREDMVRAGILPSPESARDMLGCEALGLIAEDDDILAAGALGRPLAEDSDGARAYAEIARRLMGEDIPVELPKPSSPEFQERLKRSLRLLRGIPQTRQ